MTNHTADTANTGPGSAPDAAVAALVAAVEVFIKTLAGDVPFGGGAYVLERIKAVREQMDQLTFAMLGPLAQMESSGELLEAGGQKSLKAYLTHAWGIPHGEAERLMFLAQNLHNETLPKTTAALEEGYMTVGEAAAVAAGAEREVKKRDAQANPDADEYRSKIDTGLAGLKAQKPATSVKTLTSTAHALGLELNPDRPEKNEEAAFAERGARLRTTFGGSFTFEAWGPASDGERLKAALASFTAPYGTAEKAPANGAGTNGTNGTNGAGGADGANGAGSASDLNLGLIPAGEAVTSRYARTYDALLSAAGFAHSHHGHHGHTNGNGTAGAAANASGSGTGSGTAGAAAIGGPAAADAGAGPVGDAAGYADGPEGFASGAGGAADAADSSADADAGAGGTASGGGCSQPPGTKAVINITVPLSALLGFGFAFKDETDANDANGVGTTDGEVGTTTDNTEAGGGTVGTDLNTGAATAGATTAAAVTGGFATAGGTNTTNPTNTAGAAGATESPGETGAAVGVTTASGLDPGPEPGSGPDPGGSATNTGTAVTGSAVPADPGLAPDSPGTPGYAGAPGYPGSPGVPVSSGVAVTEDGNVLALSAVRAMAPTAQIRRLIFDDRTGLPLDLGRAHRLAPGYLRTAAFAGHTTCAWSGGCDVPVSQCEADHITEFTHGGTTTAANIQPLCSTHNRLKYRRTNR